MAEYLKSCRIIVHNEEILLVLVVLFIFELEFHPENALLRILIPTVRNITVFVGDPFIVFGEKEHTVCSGLDHIADWFRLDKVQNGDIVGDFPHHAHQRDPRDSGFHMPTLHLQVEDRH